MALCPDMLRLVGRLPFGGVALVARTIVFGVVDLRKQGHKSYTWRINAALCTNSWPIFGFTTIFARMSNIRKVWHYVAKFVLSTHKIKPETLQCYVSSKAMLRETHSFRAMSFTRMASARRR